MPEEKLFKVLSINGSACHGGTGRWLLPHDGQPGEWMAPIKGKLIACQNGYHLCREQDLVLWLGSAIYEAEYRGDRLDSADKIVVQEARLLRKLETWNERSARLFACDCAEHVLSFFEAKYPSDGRPRQCIEVARRYAIGEATKEELAAARAVAGAAARAVAGDAAWAAAWVAAGDAAWAAAWVAAGDAAREAERQWQTDCLMGYLYPTGELTNG